VPNANPGDLVTATLWNAACCPVGCVMPFAGPTAKIPRAGIEWLACDGSAVSRSTYSDLYGVIGTTYGAGDGSTTFNLPDLRGRVVVGYAASGGHADVSTLGNNDGVSAANRRPKHRHTAHSHTSLVDSNVAGAATGVEGSSGLHGSYTGASTGSVDGGSGNANDSLDAPAWLTLVYIIRC
jgi:microcystin-dependent protein